MIDSMIGEYPYETTVYRLIDIREPVTDFESMFGDEVNVNHLYRRDLNLGDLYLSRSRSAIGAALEHDSVISSFKDGTVVFLTNKERMAIYGVGDTIN